MARADVLVIGGGPAGASAALLLARGGLSVMLAEKSVYPRAKVCGEFISATTWPLLEELDIDAADPGKGPPVREVGLFAGEHVLDSPMPGAQRGAGAALRREILDTALLAAAARAGAVIRQPAPVRGYRREGDAFVARIATGDGEEEVAARFVIDAHGSWERGPGDSARVPHRDDDLLGFKAHFGGTRLAPGLMPLVLFPGGYGGMVHVDCGRASFSCCVRRSMLRRIRAGNPQGAGDAVLAHVTGTCRGVREALRDAQRDSPWLSAGPIRPGCRDLHRGGVFFAGNAAGEAHPLVAEGISMAIQSSRLLASHVLAAGSLSREALDAAGRAYASEWRANFRPRLTASRAFAGLLVSPATRGAAIALLAAMPPVLTWGARLSGKARPLSSRAWQA